MKKKSSIPNLRQMHGFTLVELMITLVVAAILLTVAVPNFQAFILNNRMTSYANDMMTTLSYVRSEAVKRAANVTVCASSDGATCTGGDWEDGWVVRDAAGNVLKAQQALGGATTMTGVDTIIFSNTGRMTAPAAITTLTINAGTTGIDGRQIQIDPSGRARVCKPTCS